MRSLIVGAVIAAGLAWLFGWQIFDDLDGIDILFIVNIGLSIFAVDLRNVIRGLEYKMDGYGGLKSKMDDLEEKIDDDEYDLERGLRGKIKDLKDEIHDLHLERETDKWRRNRAAQKKMRKLSAHTNPIPVRISIRRKKD